MSLLTHTDVTSVKFYRSNILAGIGSYVSVFDKQTAKLLQRIHVLKGQNIYGFVISICGGKILVFGGKQFTVLKLEDHLFSRCFDAVIGDDWFHSGVWVDHNSIALLTAHNVVQKWNTAGLTLLSSHKSANNSILYSGLLLPVENDLIVLAGTVFSEIIIHQCGEEKTLHSLKGHRGVIFSIQCDVQKQIIVSTSDDRSLRIWYIDNPESHPNNTLAFWKNCAIECRHEVYGHTARVMRNFITNSLIVSCGEDAALCYWDLEGKLLRKTIMHQSATIWSVDGDTSHIVTGGGDGGIILHPLTVATDYYEKQMLDFEETPKHMAFTARNNLVLVPDDDELIYYDMKSKLKTVHKLFKDKKSYKMLAISPCKQLIAVADMTGNLNIYVENCKDAAYLQCVVQTELTVGKLMSTHWAGNRHLVTCDLEGKITVLAAKGTEVEIYAKFALPPCKQKFLTAVTINPENNMFICGDRNGHVHCFVKGTENPIKTFKRAHGIYGPTSITLKNNVIITTGRDSTFKYHSLKMEHISDNNYLTEKVLEFEWVEKFLDKDENLICGFRGKTFVIYNIKLNAVILEVSCGGGHRAWDAIRYFDKVDGNFEEFVQLVYVKTSQVYLITAQSSKIVSKAIVNGSQSKNINCLKTYKTNLDSSLTFFVSGGEDTTMRISSINSDSQFQDEFIFKHISNVRTLRTYPMSDNKLLVMSAGGRTQICINMFQFEKDGQKIKVSCQELADYMLREEFDERKSQRRQQDVNIHPETRMMDIDTIRYSESRFVVFAGCSDAFLRVFAFDINSKDAKFKPIKEIEHHKTCILKTVSIKFDNKDLLVTSDTRGQIVFWNVINDENEFNIVPFENIIDTNNSGTNSIDYKVLTDKLLIALGGDNNAIDIYLLITDVTDSEQKLSMKTIAHKRLNNLHCSEITGLVFVDDYMVSTSIDQRVTVCRWKVDDDTISCSFYKQVCSDVSDVQGVDVLEYSRDSVTVCVFGKGFEVLKIDLTEPE